MKRNNAEQIGDVLRQFLRQQGLETPLNEYRLVDAWKDVVGPVITRYTTGLFIKNQVLYVSLSSSVFFAVSTMTGTPVTSGCSRSDTTQDAPAVRATGMNVLPSTRVPGTATNMAPGTQARESGVMRLTISAPTGVERPRNQQEAGTMSSSSRSSLFSLV